VAAHVFFATEIMFTCSPDMAPRAIQVLSAPYKVLFWCLGKALQPGIIFTMSFLAVYMDRPFLCLGPGLGGRGMNAVRILYTCTHIGYVWAWLVLKAVYFGLVWKGKKGWLTMSGALKDGSSFFIEIPLAFWFGCIFTTGFSRYGKHHAHTHIYIYIYISKIVEDYI